MKPGEFLFLQQEEVLAAGGKNMAAAIEDCELAFSLYHRGEMMFPDKISVRFGDDATELTRGRINAMPGYIGGDVDLAGIKWIGGSPLNPTQRNMPRANGIIVLNEPQSLAPIAIMDCALISAIRTGAVTGVGAKYFANPDAKTVGLIGCGVQGHTQLMAVKTALPGIEQIRVFDIDADRKKAFADEMSAQLEMAVVAVDSGEECLGGADVAITAIVSDKPVVKKEWIGPGSYYAHVGSFECEFDVIANSDKVIVDSWSAVTHRGVSSIAKMNQAGRFQREDLHAEMGAVVNGHKPGRETPEERILFGPIGFVLHDLVIGKRIYEKAVEMGLGQRLKLYDKPIWV